MSNSLYNFRLGTFGSPVDLTFRLPFTTTGAVDTLTGAPENMDILDATQLITSSAVYLLRLSKSFSRFLDISFCPIGQKAAVTNFTQIVEGVIGGVCVLNTVSAVAGNKVTINGVDFTAVAYNGSLSATGTWRVGNSNDVTSATNLAAIINASTVAAVTADGVKATVVTDVSGTGATAVAISSKVATTTVAKTGSPITLIGGGTLCPGIVAVLGAGTTCACAATGDVIKGRIRLENSLVNPAP